MRGADASLQRATSLPVHFAREPAQRWFGILAAAVLFVGLGALLLALFSAVLPGSLLTDDALLSRGVLDLVSASAAGVFLLLPLATSLALVQAELAPRSLRPSLGWLIDMLASVPAVLWGLACALLVLPSASSGDAVLASGSTATLRPALLLVAMMLPAATRVLSEALIDAPVSLREGALALGATPARLGLLLLHASLPRTTRRLLRCLGRAVGELAPLLVVQSLQGGTLLGEAASPRTTWLAIALLIALALLLRLVAPRTVKQELPR